MWVVYILRCCDGSLYVGMTNSLPRRLGEHNRLCASWTKSRLPVELLGQEEFATRAQARQREKYLKSGCGKEWLKGQFGRASDAI